MLILSLVWCPGQNKRIAFLPFFDGSHKRRLEDHLNLRLRWAYHLSHLQYFSQLSHFGKMRVSRRNIRNVSVTPSGVKRE
jgi:hypothetical protein